MQFEKGCQLFKCRLHPLCLFMIGCLKVLILWTEDNNLPVFEKSRKMLQKLLNNPKNIVEHYVKFLIY